MVTTNALILCTDISFILSYRRLTTGLQGRPLSFVSTFTSTFAIAVDVDNNGHYLEAAYLFTNKN